MKESLNQGTTSAWKTQDYLLLLAVILRENKFKRNNNNSNNNGTSSRQNPAPGGIDWLQCKKCIDSCPLVSTRLYAATPEVKQSSQVLLTHSIQQSAYLRRLYFVA
jgi:hypothetical protein